MIDIFFTFLGKRYAPSLEEYLFVFNGLFYLLGLSSRTFFLVKFGIEPKNTFLTKK